MINLDLDMDPEAGGEISAVQRAFEHNALPSSLSPLAKRLQGLSLTSFDISTSYAARLAEALPGLNSLTLNGCWLMPGSLNELHSITGLSHVKVTSCLGSGVRPMFLVSFLANSRKPLRLHLSVGLHEVGEEEHVVDEMEEVAGLLRGLRPDASFSWDWVDG